MGQGAGTMVRRASLGSGETRYHGSGMSQGGANANASARSSTAQE